MIFDTNTVVSALLFSNGRLAWLRPYWANSRSIPLVSRQTAEELTRVLTYPKFRLSADERLELLSDYLPFCETVNSITPCTIVCRDAKDQIFLDLATYGAAQVLVTGDADLLVLAGQTPFAIETPEAYRLGRSVAG